MGTTFNSDFRATPGVERKHDYAYYQSIFEWRKGHSVAVGAVARHLPKATFWILSKQKPYREPIRQKVLPKQALSRGFSVSAEIRPMIGICLFNILLRLDRA